MKTTDVSAPCYDAQTGCERSSGRRKFSKFCAKLPPSVPARPVSPRSPKTTLKSAQPTIPQAGTSTAPFVKNSAAWDSSPGARNRDQTAGTLWTKLPNSSDSPASRSPERGKKRRVVFPLKRCPLKRAQSRKRPPTFWRSGTKIPPFLSLDFLLAQTGRRTTRRQHHCRAWLSGRSRRAAQGSRRSASPPLLAKWRLQTGVLLSAVGFPVTLPRAPAFFQPPQEPLYLALQVLKSTVVPDHVVSTPNFLLERDL